MNQQQSARRKTYWDYPYPHYRELQREDPVQYDEDLSAWLVMSYSGVLEALRHPSLSSAWLTRRADLHGEEAASAHYVRSVLSRWFVLVDAPEHQHLRKAVSRAFSPRAIAGLDPFIHERATELLHRALDAGGTTDAMGELTVPLSAGVIARLLGFAPDITAALPRWGAVFAKYLANAVRTDVADETATVVREISMAVRERLPDAPSGSLVHELTQEADSEPLSLEDLVSTITMLLYTGLEATSTLMGLGMISLMERPALRTELRDAPRPTMATAVEELLRYDTSVLQVPRVAVADLTLEGRRIRRGDLVVLMLGAANHDERRFPDPYALDLNRDVSRHLAFGHGAHFCIGAALARAEATAFFRVLLRDAPGFTLAGAPRWGSRSGVRSLDHLPVLLRADTREWPR